MFLSHNDVSLSFPSFLSTTGVSNLLESLGHTGRRVVLGHTLNTMQHIIPPKSHIVLSKFMILCSAAFTAVLSRKQPMGHRLDTPALKSINISLGENLKNKLRIIFDS